VEAIAGMMFFTTPCKQEWTCAITKKCKGKRKKRRRMVQQIGEANWHFNEAFCKSFLPEILDRKKKANKNTCVQITNRQFSG